MKQPGTVKPASTAAWAGGEEITAFLNTNILTAIVFCRFTVFCILSFSQVTVLGPIDHPQIGQ